MVEDGPNSWNDRIRATYSPIREFSATSFIGGSLRALYDDASQSCPTRMTELLDTLGAVKWAEELLSKRADILYCGSIVSDYQIHGRVTRHHRTCGKRGDKEVLAL